jgi:hypothetical protein
MSIDQTYEWAKKQKEAWDKASLEDKDLGALNKELTKGGDHRFNTITFARCDKTHFTAEVGRVEGDLVFHFFPCPSEINQLVSLASGEKIWVFGDSFADRLGDAFLDVFKFQDKLSWAFVPEMNSWAVKVAGMGSNPMTEELASKLFDCLDSLIEK